MRLLDIMTYTGVTIVNRQPFACRRPLTIITEFWTSFAQR